MTNPLGYLPAGSPIPFDHYGELTRRANHDLVNLNIGDVDGSVSFMSTQGVTTKRRYPKQFFLVVDDLENVTTPEDCYWKSGDPDLPDDWLRAKAVPWSFSQLHNSMFISSYDVQPGRQEIVHFPYLPLWAKDAIKPAVVDPSWHNPATDDIWKTVFEEFRTAIIDVYFEPITGRLISEVGSDYNRFIAKVLEVFPRAGCDMSSPCYTVGKKVNPMFPDSNDCLQPALDASLNPIELEVDWIGDHILSIDTLVEISRSNTSSGFEVTRCICDPCLYYQLQADA